jgi:hypothetical protein
MRLSKMLCSFFGFAALAPEGHFVGRAKTRDVAFTYRMGAGSPGDMTRISAAKVEAVQVDPTSPPEEYGMPGLIDSATFKFRRIVAGDQSDGTAIAAYGIIVRPYPQQENTASPVLATSTPPTSGIVDVLRSGYILARMPAGGTVHKNDPVYVWAAASTGAHVLGAVEAAATGGSTVKLNNAVFNGPADANNVVEIQFKV